MIEFWVISWQPFFIWERKCKKITDLTKVTDKLDHTRLYYIFLATRKWVKF